MKTQISKLIELALSDEAIDALIEQREELPRIINELKKEIATTTSLLENQSGAIAKLEQQKKQKELDLLEKNDWIQSRESKTKEIKTNKEYHAALKEVTQAKKNVNSLEEEIKSLAAQIEEAKTKIAEVEKTALESKERLEAEINEKNNELNNLESQIAEKQNIKVSTEQTTEAQILSRYKSIKSKISPALARAENGFCLECYTKIPPQIYIELQRLEKLIVCPRCHRLLYIPE